MSSDDPDFLIEEPIVTDDPNSSVETPKPATRQDTYVEEILINKDTNERDSSQTTSVLKQDKVASGSFKVFPERRPTIEKKTAEQTKVASARVKWFSKEFVRSEKTPDTNPTKQTESSVEENVVEQDDDDEVGVNNNNNANNVNTSNETPSSRNQIPHTVPRMRFNREPDNHAGRRSEGSTEVPPNIENSTRKESMSFVKAAEDPVSVEIIIANLPEFFNICHLNGYTLSIEYVDGVEVRMTPLTDNMGCLRKAFKLMEDVIERKKKEKEDLKAKLDDVSKELEEYKKKVDELLCKKEEDSDDKGNNPFPRRTSSKRKPHHGEIDYLQFDPKFLKDLYTKLVDNVRGKPRSPFFLTSSYTERRTIIIDYLDFLRFGMDRVCTETNIKMCKQFENNWKQFVFKPFSHDLNKRMDEFKEKFKLRDPIVGSVQFIEFDSDDNQRYYLCMAICNNRIVAWRSKPSKQGALKGVYKTLYACDWNTDFKFAVNVFCSFPSKMDDYYVECHEKDIYQEDGKPVKWLKENFPSLEANIYGYHDEALPAIYNTAAPFM